MGAKKLIEFLREKEKEDELYHKLEEIKANAENFLAKITETFPKYTIHNIKHSEKVLEKLDEIVIPDSLKQEMYVYEIFFLIASAYLHDIGMVDFPELIGKHKEEFEEFIKEEKLKEQEISDEEAKRRFIREHHHLRSEEYIVEHYEDFGIKKEDEHQARIIGKICKGHRKEDLSNKEFDSDRSYKNETINEPMLSAFLRIADELDLDFERAPLIIYEAFKPKDAISQEEWEKNLSVSGVARSKEDPSLIKVSATCKSSRVHRALKMFEVKVQDELLKLRDYLHHYKEFHKELPVRIIVDIKPDGYKPYDIKFSLRGREITQLLMGENLYERKDACIRELLQNAVDACRMRRELLKKKGLDYKPGVIFELTHDGKLIVSDNGNGMDENIVENYFAQIGRCFYTSPDFLTQELEFTPASRFGIGILSCFMIADKLEVETKKEESEPLLIEIDSMFDYFFVRKGRRKDTGTAVTLFLKEEVWEEIEDGKFDLEEIVRYYARHLEFPVEVKVPEKEPVVIEDEGYACEEKYSSPSSMFDLALALSKAKDTFGKTYYEVHINEEDIEGIICISLANIVGYHFLLPVDDEAFISRGGIFVGNCSLIPVEFTGLLFAELNIKGDILDLTVSRNDVLINEKHAKLESRLRGWIFKGLEDFFKEFRGTQTPLGPFDFNLLLERYFHGMVDRCILDEISQFPDSFLNLAREYFDFLVFTKEGVCKMRYKEMEESGKKVVVIIMGGEYYIEKIIISYWSCSHISSRNATFSYLEEIVKSCSGFKEDEFYIADSEANIIIFFGKSPDISKIPQKFLRRFFEMEESNNLDEIISPLIKQEIKLVKFKNYRTKRFIEDFLVVAGRGTGPDRVIPEIPMRIREIYLNAEHKFSKLLANEKDVILRDKNAIQITENFFKSILKLAKIGGSGGITFETNSFADILDNQRHILEWFVEKGLISEREMSDYELRKEDFPPIWF